MSVRFALLGLLTQRPRHGYELHAAFEALIGGEQTWDLKPAQVYTTLARLEDGGLVVEEALEQGGGPEKRIYAVTPAGRQVLTEWLAAGVERDHGRDEFFLKLMLALLTGAGTPVHMLQTQRALLYRELHAATTQRNDADPRLELARLLMLDKVIMHLEADLRWLDMVEARWDDIRRQPLPEPEAKPRGRPRKTLPAGEAE